MVKMRVMLLGVAAACLVPQAVSAKLWTFQIGGDVTGSGVMTTADAADANSAYDVTAISGLFAGDTITALMPPLSFGGNHNLIYPDADTVLDSFGVTFVAGGRQNNIYYNGSDYLFTQDRGDYGTISLTLAPASNVPEPSSWVMMIAGFGLAGAALRRLRRASLLRPA